MSDSLRAEGHKPRDWNTIDVPAVRPAAPKPRKKRKLDDQRQTAICAMMTVGTSLRMAARLTGVSVQAVHQLAQRDPVFGERLRNAHMLSQVTPLQTIYTASKTHWRAAAWLLERTNRQEFGRTSPNQVTQARFDDFSEEIAEEINASIPDKKTRKLVKRACDKAAHRQNKDLFA